MNRTSSVLAAALGLSLLGNVYLGGVIAGRDFLQDPPPHGAHGPEPRMDRKFKRNLDQLSPQGRAHVEKIWDGVREEMRSQIGESWQSRRAMREALKADPFDRPAFEAARKDHADTHRKARALIEQAMADIAEGLSAADRKAFFERRGRRGPGHRPPPPPGEE